MRRLAQLLAPLTLALACALGHAANTDQDFLAATDAARKDDLKKLAALAPDLAAHPLAAYVDYWLLSARLKEAAPDEARGFLTRYPDSPLADKLRADWLRQVGRDARWDLFRTEFAALAQPDTELTCFWLQARIAAQEASALVEARPLWLTGATQPDACVPLFDALIAQGSISQSDIWERVRLALDANNLGLARQLAGAATGAPLLNVKSLDAAARDPQRFLDRGAPELSTRGGRELAIYALVRLARSDAGAAAARMEAIEARLPAEDRRYAWGQIAYRAALNLDPGALAWYAKAGDASLSDAQLSWKSRAALRARNWPAVRATIERLSEAEQRDAAWRYWKARALKAQGKAAEANELLTPLARETHFYGILSAEEIGAPLPKPEQTWKPAESEVAAAARIPGLQRGLLLQRLGLSPEANREWIYAVRAMNDRELLAAAEVARRADWLERSINTADRTRELHNFAQRYPTPWREAFSAQARAKDLDESWVYGLTRQESRFMPEARSPAGALGLMQVMPATARWIARHWGDGPVRVDDLTDVHTNLALGTWYLRYALDSLGHPVLATAGYNAGPNRARRWRAESVLEGAIYAESIPIAETRDYVKRVMANATLYADRLGLKPVSLRERLGMIPGIAREETPLTQETAQAPDLRN